MRISTPHLIASSLLLLLLPNQNNAQPTVKDEQQQQQRQIRYFQPYRIPYSTLELPPSSFRQSPHFTYFLDALITHGIISISNVPSDFSSHKKETLKHLHSCALTSSATRRHTYDDGTIRHTMATHTVPGPGGQQSFRHDESKSEIKQEQDQCDLFSNASDELRRAVGDGVRVFSEALQSVLMTSMNDDSTSSSSLSSLLQTRDGYDFGGFDGVVENGEHLEHFHSYQRAMDNYDNDEADDTIPLHTDQGLFIAFTPALIVDSSSQESSLSTNDVIIETGDGQRATLQLHEDDLVIMLGDGINQIVNPLLLNEQYSFTFRATPHAVHVAPQSSKDDSRVWYGRMVLPPPDAIHPKDSSVTFGEWRHHVTTTTTTATTSTTTSTWNSLGCSGDDHSISARQLEETVCDSGSTYCWHRCMAHADHDVSETICAERNLQLQCINPRDQLYEGGHGDYYPACSNTTDPVTPFPDLPGYPANQVLCDDAAWEEFSSSEGYDFVFDKLGDNRGNRDLEWDGALMKGGNVSKFMWNIVDGDKIQGRLVFNGLFGYLAMGFAHPTGSKNGMQGASIIMALPGGDFSSQYGLDPTLDDTVLEYQIDFEESRFRHWSAPIANRDTSTYEVTSTDCFTAMTFTTDSINSIKFNLTGTDRMIWAANGQNLYCEYHGRGRETDAGDRDHFVVEWGTGKAWFTSAETMEVETSTTNGVDVESSASTNFMRRWLSSIGLFSLGIIAFGMVV